MATQDHRKLKGIKHYEAPSEPYRHIIQEPYKAKKCYFYRDGDTKFKAVTLCIHPRKYKRLETLISELTTKVKLPFGVRSIFTPRGRDMITSLDNLENGESYVCSPLRQQAKGVDPKQVASPPRWYHDKPSSGTKELSRMLQEQEFKNKTRPIGKMHEVHYQKMVYPYNRIQPKKITVLKNGEPKIHHVVLINRKTAQTFDQFLTDISGIFRMAVSKLLTLEGRRVTNLASVISGPDVLVAAGKEPFKKMIAFEYEPVESPIRKRLEMSRMDMHSRMDTNRAEMRSRLDINRTNMKSRLDMNHNENIKDRAGDRPIKNREKMTKTRGRWKVWCTTNQLSSAGTTSQVTITVYGNKEISGPIPLGFPDNKIFQCGQVDQFDLDLGSNIGEIYKIRIAHDNTGDHPGWFCDEIRMQDEDTDESLVFPCRRWLSRNEDDHEICREIPADRKGQPQLPVIKYEVTVITGDLWNGGTRSNVYLTIYGERGDSGVRQLYVSNKEEAFNKGQTNHITLEAVSLGHLKRVIVGHDGTAAGDGWYLEKLSIQEPDAKPHEVYHFYCGRWLDEGEEDGKIVRELKVQDDYMEDILEKRNWEFEKWKFDSKNQVMLMSLLTGKALRIKPDGVVDGLGDAKNNGSVFIVSSKKPMVRVFTSLFNNTFHLAIDQGKVTGQGRGGPQCEFRLHVQSDRTLMLEGVKFPLQFITLQENGKLGDPRSVLDKDPAKRFHVYVKGVLRHRGVIMLRTSNIQAIGVDHDKLVHATGRCNRAAHFRVHKVDESDIHMFESMIYQGFYLRLKEGKFDCNGSRNEDSYFHVEKHKHKGYYALQSHKQRGMYMGFSAGGDVIPTIDSGTSNIYIFPEVIEFGIPKNQLTDDKLTPISERISYNETPDMRRRVKPENEDGDYRVLISTAESLDQGQVTLVFFGDKGTTGPIVLSGPTDNGPRFKAGNTDEFKVNLAKIGKLLKVRLELAPQSQSNNPSWKVQKLVLMDMNTLEKLAFDFNCRLSREQDNQDLMKELPVIRPGCEEDSLPVVKYFVTVFTGKDPGSETDAQIYMTMFGDFGDSGKRELRVSNRARPFQQGQSDTFEIEAVHLGNLNKIQIGHSETRPKDGWFCEKVVIREGRTANMEFLFPCGRWFDSGMEDKKLERTLMIQDTVPAQPTRSSAWKMSPLAVPPHIGVFEENIVKDRENGAIFMELDEIIPADEFSDPPQATVTSINEIGHTTFNDNTDENINKEVFDVDIDEREDEKTDLTRSEMIEVGISTMGNKKDDGNLDISYTGDDGNHMKQVKKMPQKEEATRVKKHFQEYIHLWITTQHDSSANMQDTVILYLYGKDGSSGPITVGSGRDGLFKSGSTDEMTLGLDQDVGKLYKIRVGLAEEQSGYDWHLEKLKLLEKSSGEEFDFDVNRWMSRQKEDCDVWRELPILRFDEPPLPVIIYTVEVHTSDISGADTSAAIFVNLFGQRGDSGKRKLHVTQTEGKIFSQGKIDKFLLEAVSLGVIKSIVICHSEKKAGHGWHLAYVAVKEYNLNDEQMETFFPCDRWFDTGQDDHRTERELFPGQRPKNKPRSNGEYRMWVTTAEDSEPANGGKAVLVIYGDKGKSGNIDLFAPNSTAKLFEAANTDEFEVSAGDIGDIYKIRITREDKEDWRAWHLEEIKLEDKTTGEVFTFHFDRWLSRDMENGDLSMELPLIALGNDELTIKRYEVHVVTGDHWAGGTDANVYIVLFGSRGDSGRRMLHKSKSIKRKFQRAEEDIFIIEAVDLNNLESVVVGHNGKGPGAGWFLKFITVTEINGTNSASHFFPCEKWLDEREADGKIERTLRKIDAPKLSASYTMPSECGGQWKVKVKTSEVPNAGTQAQVYITISGTKDFSHPIPLGNSSSLMEYFLPAKESMFDVTIGEIGELAKIRLELDNKSKDLSWHVDWVQMKHLQSGFECLFTFNCLLAEDKDDGQVFRERAVDSPDWMPAPVLRYIIIVQTGRKPNSGAHGGFCTINLLGSQGITGQQKLSRPLGTSADCMKDGMLDVYMLEAVCVGEVRSIQLGFDGKGRAKRWFVDSVKVMESLSALSESVYIANTWLDHGEHRSVTLALSETVTATSLPRGVDSVLLDHNVPETKGSWELWIWTGKQESAGTSGVIVVVLCGTTGSSAPIYLNKDKDFHTSSIFHTKIESGRIGDLFKIRLAFAERVGHSWYLERLKLKDSDTKQEFSFDYNNWLNCTEENQDGMVELPATRPDIPPLSENTYRVTIVTGDLPCAETSAEVTLMMIGQWGDSGQRNLTKPLNNKVPFDKGQIDEFDLKLLNLGKISKILIGHGDYGRGQGWFCQQLSVTSTNQRGDKIETVFVCNRWFDTGVDDRQMARVFSAIGTVSLKDIVSPTGRATSKGIWSCYIKMAGIDKLDTSNLSHSASHQVSIVIYGTKGITGPLELGDGKKGVFFPGQIHSFKGLRIGNIGDLTKLRLSSSEGNRESVWAIEEVLLEDNVTGEKLRFDFSRYVNEMSEEHIKELPVIRPGTVVPPLIKYIVRVETENKQGAGTIAKVYATLYGLKGDSGRRLLNTDATEASFRQGKEKTFEMEAVDLGSLEKLVVTKGPGDPWLLKQIVVKAGLFEPIENVFIWNKWIGNTDRRDQEVEITLKSVSSRPSSVAVPTSQFPDFPVTRGQWRVETTTGSIETTGDTTDVIVIFCGHKIESSPVNLTPTNDKSFQSGMKDIFELSLAEDVGELIKIRLGFEDNSKNKKWHLEKIKFEDIDTKDTFLFAPNDHLSVSDDSDGWLEFPVIWPGVFILPIVRYTITIVTDDMPETASKAQILIKLDGQMGSSGYRTLKDRARIQHGQTIKSVIEAVSLTSLDSLTIGHTDKNPGAGWYLSGVTVRPSNEEMDYVFICNRWMDAGQDDGETMRTIYYNPNNNTINMNIKAPPRLPPRTQTVQDAKFIKERKPTLTAVLTEGEDSNTVTADIQQEEEKLRAGEWRLYVTTSSQPDSGTDANVFLTVIGNKGHTKPFHLGSKHQKCFETGMVYHFDIWFHHDDIGEIKKVRLEHDNSGAGNEWRVDKLVLENLFRGQKYTLNVNRWLSYKEEEGDIVYEGAVDSSHKPTWKDCKYMVKTVTEAEKNSGTEANVYINIIGSQGDCGKRFLKHNIDGNKKFATGKTNSFLIEAVDLGDLEKIIIGHDGIGPDSSWKLQCVMIRVENSKNKETCVFPWGKWLTGTQKEVTILKGKL